MGENAPKKGFDRQPVLTGNTVELRPLRPDDFHDLYKVASDPLIWEQHPARDRYQEEVFQAFFPGGAEVWRGFDSYNKEMKSRSGW